MDALVEQLLEGSVPIAAVAARLGAGEAADLAARLKAEADRHWWINANRSLELAQLIMELGELRREPQHVALGLMARGDALKLLGRAEEAWAALGEAGGRFLALGDVIGWARTRIGRLLICVDLQRVDEALADAERARAIFAAAGVVDKGVILDMNCAIVHHMLGDHQRSLRQYEAALATAAASPAIGGAWLGPIHTNMGFLYDQLGDFLRAGEHYDQGRRHFAERDEARGVAMIDVNSAHIAMAQGQYRGALQLLHRAHAYYTEQGLGLDAAQVDVDRVECHLLLNRFAEASELAGRAAETFRGAGASYWEALTLLHRATAEAELGEREAALASIAAAEAIFAGLAMAPALATARLRRGQIALLHGALGLAADEAAGAAAGFAASGRQVDLAEARLLEGRALLAERRTAEAAAAAAFALQIARRCNVPHLRYGSHLLMGHVAAAWGHGRRAARAYRAAMATIDRVQQGLTITLRPSFLQSRGEAFHALMGLALREGRTANAFELLERGKSQTLLGHIANRDQLRWRADNPGARAQLAELERLRAEHHWFYQIAQGAPPSPDAPQRAVTPEEARARLAPIEQQMRALTEQLYLRAEGPGERVAPPSLAEVRGRLAAGEALVEFYADGSRLWAFALTQTAAEVVELLLSPSEVEACLDQLQLNLRAALNVGPGAPLSRRLATTAQGLLGRLYRGLLAPVAKSIAGAGRLLVVPYGALHYVPFHLLHTGRAHLVELQELAILPAAGLLTRPRLRRPPGALVLAHSAGGLLPHAVAEAGAVHARFGGALYAEGQATRAALQAPAAQILHIAAHGEQRLDQPDLSYIRLADGQLYADDLLQQDLSYELVTLSACETGRAAVAPGDELIGLGRGVLYAGAASLITSLWRVADTTTAALMEQLYAALARGASKAAALREAQTCLIASEPGLHPAYWGAFQLVGDAGALTPRIRPDPSG